MSSPIASADQLRQDYHQLKAGVHQELLNQLNLERLTRVKREDAEPELRRVIGVIIESFTKASPMSLMERETLVADVLNELFGLGPLEALLRDPEVSDILVNRYNRILAVDQIWEWQFMQVLVGGIPANDDVSTDV